jgi:hypothetical protein
MTVRELIKRLQMQDPEAIIVVMNDEESFDEVDDVQPYGNVRPFGPVVQLY